MRSDPLPQTILARIRRLLTPPVFPQDQNKTRLAANLFFMLHIGVLGLLFLTAAQASFSLDTLALRLAVLALLFSLGYMAKRGLVRGAALIFVFMVWLLIMYSALDSGGVQAVGYTGGGLMVVLLAGFLLSRRFVLVFYALTILFGGVLVWMQDQGVLPAVRASDTPLNRLVAYGVFLAVGVGLSFITLRSVQKALDQARKQLREREQAESALKVSEKRYRVVSEMMSDFAYAYDIHPDGSFTPIWITEESFKRVTGYAWDEINTTFNLYHPDDRERARRHAQQTMQGQPVSDDYRIVTRSGETRWLHVDRQVEYSDDGRPIRFYGSSRDITESMRAKEAILNLNAELENQAAQLATLNQIMRDISSLTDLTSTLKRVLLKLEAVLPLDVFFVALYDDVDQTVTFPVMYDSGQFWDQKPGILSRSGWIGQVLQTGQALMFNRTPEDIAADSRHHARLGAVDRVSASIMMAPLPIGDRIIGVVSVQSYALNSYERKHLELLTDAGYQIAIAVENARLYDSLQNELAERKQAEEALRESEERFRIISSATSDYTFASTFDEQGELKHTLLTGAFEAISGYSPEEFIALGGWRATLHPDDRAQDERDMAALRQNQPVVSEVRIIKKGGEVRWVRVYARPYWDAERHILTGIYGGVQDITEKKQAEQALAESEKKFRTIFELAPYGITIQRPDGEFVDFNQAFLDRLGTARDEFLGKNFLEAMRWGDLGKLLELMQELLDRGQVINREVMFYRANGDPAWLLVSSQLLELGGESLVMTVGADITERKQAEEALRRSEALLRALLDATTDVAFLMALDGTFMTVNKATADAMKLDVQSLTAMNGFDLMSPELRAARRPYFDAVRESGQPVRFEDYGIIGWSDNSVYPVFSPSGVVEAFAVYSRDINEQKRLADELQQYTARLEEMVEERTAQLRRSKEQTEIILNNTRDAVALAQPNGDICTTNPAFAALFGDDMSQSIERILWAVGSDEHIVLVSSALIRAMWLQEQQRVEAQIVSADGSDRDVDLAFIPVRLAEEAERYGVLVSAHDITHLKEIERFKARFVADAVHDLATPITGLSTRLYLLKRSPERLEDHVKALENQVAHLRNLLADLRTLSQLDRRQLALSLEMCNLNPIVMRVFDTYEPVAISKEQTLKLRLDPLLPDAPLDPRQIERVLVNLIANAINYTPNGKTVCVRTGVQGDTVFFQVQDEGIGISAEDLPHVFERFYRTAHARQTRSSGTGLGLAIVQEIVNLHGGSVTASSEPGQGSIFTVALPIQPTETASP